MAEDTGGFELHLDRAPLKYPGLQPWEILISEAQERMTLAVPPDKLDAFMNLAREMDVEATDLGAFTDSGFYPLPLRGADGHLPGHGVSPRRGAAAGDPGQVGARRRRPNRSSPSHAISRRRCSTCSAGSTSAPRRAWCAATTTRSRAARVVKPLAGVDNDGPSDAAVVRPLFDSFAGVVIAHGICPRYSDIDTYHMMACAIDEAVRNYVAVGGNIEHVAGLDNFCWCDPVKSEKTPDGEYKAAQLVRANQALYDYCLAFGVPLISGKDSMKNDYQIGDTKISIPPTVLFSVIGKIDDVRTGGHHGRQAPRRPGLRPRPDPRRAGRLRILRHARRNRPQRAQGRRRRAPWPVTGLSTQAQARGLIASCHDLSDGGLGVALAESAFAGGCGLHVELAQLPVAGVLRDDVMLFSESQSRLLVTVHPEHMEAFEALFAGQDCGLIGRVIEEKDLLIFGSEGQILVKSALSTLKEAWQRPLREL